MTPTQATAEIFWTAFRSLPHREQDAVLFKIIRDATLREDVIDMAIGGKRRREKVRSFPAVVREIRKERGR